MGKRRLPTEYLSTIVNQCNTYAINNAENSSAATNSVTASERHIGRHLHSTDGHTLNVGGNLGRKLRNPTRMRSAFNSLSNSSWAIK